MQVTTTAQGGRKPAATRKCGRTLATILGEDLSPSPDGDLRQVSCRGGEGGTCPVGDRARPRTPGEAPRSADLRRGESKGGEESSPVACRHACPPVGTPAPGSPDVGPAGGVSRPRALPPPAQRHLGALRRLLRTAQNRCLSTYSPVLPGARPPVTPTARATARRSSSAPRGEARTVAMSGPGGPELRDARTQPGRRRTRKGSASGRWTSRDWLRRAQAPPLGRE